MLARYSWVDEIDPRSSTPSTSLEYLYFTVVGVDPNTPCIIGLNLAQDLAVQIYCASPSWAVFQLLQLELIHRPLLTRSWLYLSSRLSQLHC